MRRDRHAAPPDLRLPPGTRADASGQLVSGRGLRDTTDFLAKELARRGIAVRQIGPTRVRGVELTRFISQTAVDALARDPRPAHRGKTLIFFVPADRLDETRGPLRNQSSLGDRLMAGRQTLDLTIMVRIHVPEPRRLDRRYPR